MRREARELAMQVLFHNEFEKDFRIGAFLELYEKKFTGDTLTYAQNLADGTQLQLNKIDEMINAVSNQWKVQRMSSVDRNIIRIAVFEMKFSTDPIQPQVAINEALEIAKKYSANESTSFINGILDQVAKK